MADPEYDSWINTVRESADIVDVIGRTVSLKRKGKHYWGLCPFHQERTPSFSVDSEQQLFYCFGCHVGGTVFTYLMQHDGLSFSEAADLVAAEVGMPRPQKDDKDTHKARHFSQLQAIMEWSQQFYLEQAAASPVFEAYMHKRRVDPEAQRRFGLGFAPDSWTGLADYLKKHGSSEDDMLESGVVVARKEGRGVFDRWRNRLMFPIWNHRGQVIGFGGRAVAPDQEPKYLNSPETPLFHKSRVLYGEHLARPLWRQGRRPLLVEGNFDVIACHQAGLGQAVASLGTALTADHARLLARHGKEVDLLYDSDAAGQDAMRRAFLILSAEGLQVNRVSLNAGKDPDEFLQEKGASSLAENVARRIPYFEAVFKERAGQPEYQSARGKALLVEEIKPLWMALGNVVEQAGYLELVSRTLRLDQSILAQSFGIKQGARHISSKNRHNMERAVSKRVRPSHDVYLLALLFQHPEAASRVMEVLPEWVQRNGLADVLRKLEMGLLARDVTSDVDAMDPDLRALVLEALTLEGPDGGIRVIEDTVKVIQRQEDDAQWQALIERLRRGENTPELLEEIQRFQSALSRDQMGQGSWVPLTGRIGKEG